MGGRGGHGGLHLPDDRDAVRGDRELASSRHPQAQPLLVAPHLDFAPGVGDPPGDAADEPSLRRLQGRRVRESDGRVRKREGRQGGKLRVGHEDPACKETRMGTGRRLIGPQPALQRSRRGHHRVEVRAVRHPANRCPVDGRTCRKAPNFTAARAGWIRMPGARPWRRIGRVPGQRPARRSVRQADGPPSWLLLLVFLPLSPDPERSPPW